MPRILASIVLFSMPLAAQVCQTQALGWPDPQANARVGTSVARDLDTAVAGGPFVDTQSALGGAVYVWRQTAGLWNLEQKITTPNNLGPNTSFGRVVALSGDRLVSGGSFGSNLVWLHRRTGTQWSLAGSIPPSGYTYAIQFGYAVAVDGEWIAVGAPQATATPTSTTRTGAVYLFRDVGGAVSEVDQLRPPTLVGQDDAGISLAMRSSVLAMGSAVGTQNAATGAGATFVYRIVQGQAVLEATLQSPAVSPGRDSQGATFGRAVATDGQRVAVADISETVGPFQSGAVHLWLHQAGIWVYEGTVVGQPNTCGFGSKIAIDGDELIVGQSCGHRISHFRRVGGSWVEQGITVAQNGGSFAISSIALLGGELTLGSAINPGTPSTVGQVVAYQLGSGSMPYGTGLAGSGNQMPELFGSGCPRVGQPYSVDLSHGIGGGFALLAIGFQNGQTSLVGGTLWVSSIVGSTGMLLGGGLGQPGVGGFQYPFAVPSAAFVGLRLYFQAGVLDPGAVQGFALSNALEVVMGN